LGRPATYYFDEIVYVRPAARLLLGWDIENPEHPLLGKSLLAVGMRAFGNGFVGLRLTSMIAGALGLFAMSRAVWWYSRSRIASILFALLLGTNFTWLVLSRTAVIDPFMFGFIGGALLFFVKAADGGRWDSRYMALTGLCLGLAMGTKWLASPVCVSIALTYAWLNRTSFRALVRGGVYLGIVPIATYLVTFLPGAFVRTGPITLDCLLPLQLEMLDFLNRYDRPQPYASQWWQWVLNIRPFWGWVGDDSGSFRLVLIAGNPVTMLLGAGAVAVGLYRWIRHHDWQLGVICVFYAIFLLISAISGRPTQYFHYYLVPFSFALACLSLLLARLWDRGIRWPGGVTFGLSALVFAWYFPVLTAAPLTGKSAIGRYDWPPGWEVKTGIINGVKWEKSFPNTAGEICDRVSASRASARQTSR